MLSGQEKGIRSIILDGGLRNKKKTIDSLYLIKLKPFDNTIKEENVSKTGEASGRRCCDVSIRHVL